MMVKIKNLFIVVMFILYCKVSYNKFVLNNQNSSKIYQNFGCEIKFKLNLAE